MVQSQSLFFVMKMLMMNAEDAAIAAVIKTSKCSPVSCNTMDVNLPGSTEPDQCTSAFEIGIGNGDLKSPQHTPKTEFSARKVPEYCDNQCILAESADEVGFPLQRGMR